MGLFLTKKAVDDPKEAAHGTDHRGNNFISPLDFLVALQPHLSQTQQLAGGSHDDCGRGGKEGCRVEAVRRNSWISGPHPWRRVCLQTGSIKKRQFRVRLNEVKKEKEGAVIDYSLYSAVSADTAVITLHNLWGKQGLAERVPLKMSLNLNVDFASSLGCLTSCGRFAAPQIIVAIEAPTEFICIYLHSVGNV